MGSDIFQKKKLIINWPESLDIKEEKAELCDNFWSMGRMIQILMESLEKLKRI